MGLSVLQDCINTPVKLSKELESEHFFSCGKQSVVTEDIIDLFISGLWLETSPNNLVLKKVLSEVRNLYV